MRTVGSRSNQTHMRVSPLVSSRVRLHPPTGQQQRARASAHCESAVCPALSLCSSRGTPLCTAHAGQQHAGRHRAYTNAFRTTGHARVHSQRQGRSLSGRRCPLASVLRPSDSYSLTITLHRIMYGSWSSVLRARRADAISTAALLVTVPCSCVLPTVFSWSPCLSPRCAAVSDAPLLGHWTERRNEGAPHERRTSRPAGGTQQEDGGTVDGRRRTVDCTGIDGRWAALGSVMCCRLCAHAAHRRSKATLSLVSRVAARTTPSPLSSSCLPPE